MTRQEKTLMQGLLEESQTQTGFMERLDERTTNQAASLERLSAESSAMNAKLDTVIIDTQKNTSFRRVATWVGGAVVTAILGIFGVQFKGK